MSPSTMKILLFVPGVLLLAVCVYYFRPCRPGTLAILQPGTVIETVLATARGNDTANILVGNAFDLR